ncbi:cardiolipin synthase [Anaerobacillus isosaccharinicus]|uniref:Cardiolipin synthase n=1 Tax=Anaerobacillus isosaccharinicus TaxID=1532552 RepID=A0A1S2L0P3_9BACI|nr:cardiolipin synthase [Anaerobacillus isosaccharinicus]MBA5584329.1 cardiolipin synthase [Anaerobacillus isosaccharinicus]QOY37273.1 cardiolipin synthase [Anaerobacillus isosaccharinicus]
MLLMTIFAIILLLIIWMWIDFKLGIKKQRSEANRFVQEIRNGQCEMLTTGHDLFKKLITDINNAEKNIHVLFYIFRDDHIGTQVLKALKEKAIEGVEVRLLVDRVGCHISKKMRNELKKVGVRFAHSHPPKFPYLFFTLNRRNHRKITVIDGHIGYIGGYNVGDEYLGRDPKFGDWRDIHLRIVGDGCQDLQEQFLQDWVVATREKIDANNYYPPLAKGLHQLKIVPSDGTFLEEAFINFIKEAKDSIYIGTPYFIPGNAIKEELIAAAKRGVDVKLIVPKQGDHPFVREAAFPYFQPLLEAGCTIHRYYRGFYHAKTIVIDKEICDIGTANVDRRSFHINHEINCLIFNKEFIKDVIAVMDHDISISEQLTMVQLKKRSFFHKSKEKIATVFAPLL